MSEVAETGLACGNHLCTQISKSRRNISKVRKMCVEKASALHFKSSVISNPYRPCNRCQMSYKRNKLNDWFGFFSLRPQRHPSIDAIGTTSQCKTLTTWIKPLAGKSWQEVAHVWFWLGRADKCRVEVDNKWPTRECVTLPSWSAEALNSVRTP